MKNTMPISLIMLSMLCIMSLPIEGKNDPNAEKWRALKSKRGISEPYGEIPSGTETEESELESSSSTQEHITQETPPSDNEDKQPN